MTGEATMSGTPSKRRCYCGDPFRADGTCRHGCDPALSPAALRKQRTEAKRRAHAARVASEDVYFSPTEDAKLGDRLARLDPLYGKKRSWARRGRFGGAR